MKDKILEIRNLSFSYEQEKFALDHITLAIYKNEKIAVLGANGAGKSTFFLNLNGVREPDSGEIFLHGEKIGKKTRNNLRKSVGIVFQDADSQIIASNVKAEIAFGPLNMKLSGHEVETRTEQAINRLNLQELAERPPHYLSGGEKKRVTIADIIAMESEIFVFDEPTASLDPAHATLLENILSELEEEGKTILLSTHDVDFAYRFANRLIIFHEGKLLADGKPEHIFVQEELLKKSNLKKPLLMQMYELLTQKKILDSAAPCPKTLAELENLL